METGYLLEVDAMSDEKNWDGEVPFDPRRRVGTMRINRNSVNAIYNGERTVVRIEP